MKFNVASAREATRHKNQAPPNQGEREGDSSTHCLALGKSKELISVERKKRLLQNHTTIHLHLVLSTPADPAPLVNADGSTHKVCSNWRVSVLTTAAEPKN